MSSNNYDKLSDTELHQKLKAVGFDLPVSINRDFLIRKLQQTETDITTRQTTGTNNVSGGGTNKKRLSLNTPQTPVTPNSRPARNSLSTNHQPVQPASPPTPPRNHKQLTPPRQLAKPTTPPPLTPPAVRKQKQKPVTPTRTQKIPFTNKYLTVNETEESEDEEEDKQPVQLPKTFVVPRKSNSLQVVQPKIPTLNSERYKSYMKLFNNHEMPNHRNSGRYSSDDDESGDEVTNKPSVTTQRRVDWNKYKDYSYSKLPTTPNAILILFVTFGFVVIGSYLKIQANNADQDPLRAIDNKGQQLTSFTPICGVDGVDPVECIPPEDLYETKKLFVELRDELNQRRYKIDCKSADDEDASDNLSFVRVKSLLYHLSSLTKPRIDATFQYLLYMIIENPKWGLIVETELSNGTRTQLTEIYQLTDGNYFVTTNFPDRAWYCSAMKYISNGIYYILIITILVFIGYGCYLIYSLYLQRKQENEKRLFKMIEDILSLLQEHHENSETGNDAPLAIHHIRDNLIQPSERTIEKLNLWTEAIQYILTNESRVREEMYHIRGEEYRVLKWLPTISPKRANTTTGGWQGQAFEIVDGSPNSLPLKIPTNCLKVRHMYDTKSPLTEELKTKIEASLRTKADIELKHVGYDNHNDCCVYVKCHSKEEAKKAYLNLHGWWYNGKLLSVKFLREERYDTRFPEAK